LGEANLQAIYDLTPGSDLLWGGGQTEKRLVLRVVKENHPRTTRIGQIGPQMGMKYVGE
jgi:hypothetical protein